MSEIKRLLNSLLWEIYGQNPSSISQKPYKNRQKRMHPKLYEPRLLQKLSTNILNDICGILQLEIRLMSKYLERVLISRDKNRTHNTILYGFLDVIVSARLGEPSREMRFSLSPPPGAVTGRPDPGRSSQSSDEANSSSDFNQWLHAMKLVARLPGGMPPEFRRKLWLALSDKYLKSKNVDWEKEEIKCFSEQWREDDEELGIQIVKDLHRTGSSLCSGPAGTINQAKLKRILLGYARYNPEVGYCQGFNMLGALILQVMDKEEIESIKVMIYLVEGILPGGYFSGSLGGLQADMAVFRELMTSKLPRLAKHLQKLQGPVENAFEPPLTNVFTMQWFLTMFCTCLPMTCVLRVWDLVLIEGSDVLLRTALVLWSLLEERILNARTADDFYCKMGSFSSELLNGHLIDSNGLIEKVVELGPIPELQKLRDKHLYNISPFRDKKGLQLYYSDEEGDSDEDSRMAVATAWGLRLSRRGSAGFSQKTDGKDRIALDISLLKKQYDRLRERQRQAHIILTSAVARQGSNPNQSSIQMNQLLIGRNAIVTNNGRRLGPPQGAIPPARKPSLPTAKLSKPAQTKTLRRGETLHWRDTDLSKRRRGSLKWKDIKSDSSQSGQDDRGSQLIESAPSSRSSSSEPKSQKTSLKARQRSDSSSYSEDSDGNSSTSTSLCDEDDHEVGNVSSLEGSPLKKSKSSKKHSEVPHKKCLEDVLNSNDKHHSTDSQIPFIQLSTMDSPVMNANKTEIDSLAYAKEDSDTESNRLDYAGFVDEYSWPDMNESTSSAPPEDITVDVTSDEGDFLSLSNVITSTSQLSPIPDIATYINNSSISPLRTPISAFDYANLVVSMEESKKFDVNDEGVTNEYFERVNIVERPTKLDLLYSLNEEDSIRNAYKTQSSETSPEQILHKDLDLSHEERLGDSSEFLTSTSCTNNFKPSSEELDRKMKVLLEYSNQSSLSFIAEAKHEISSGMFKGKEFDPLSLKYQPLVPISSNSTISEDEKSEKAALKSPSNDNAESADVETTLKSESNMSEIKVESSSTATRPPTEGDLQIQDQIEPCKALDLKSTEIPQENIDPDTPAVEKETEGIVSHIPSTEDLEMRFKALEMNFSDRKKHSAESESQPTGQNKFSEIKTESNLSAPATLKSPISDLSTTAVLQTDEGASSTLSPIQPQHLKQDSDLSDPSHPPLEGEDKKNDSAVSSSQCQPEVMQSSSLGYPSSYLAKDETREFVPDQDSSTYSKDDINRHSLSYDHLHSVKESQIERDKSEIPCSIEVSEVNESVVPEKDSDHDRLTVLSGKYETDLLDEFKPKEQEILNESKLDILLINSEAEADEPIIEKEARKCRSVDDSAVGKSVNQEEVFDCGSIVLPTTDESGEAVIETSSDLYSSSIHTVMGVPEVDELLVLEQTKDNQLDVVNKIESKEQEVKESDSSQLHNNMEVSEVDESEGLEQTPNTYDYTVTLPAKDQSDLDKECNLGESIIDNDSSIDISRIQSAQSVSEAKDNVGPIALSTKVQSNPVIKGESGLDESRTQSTTYMSEVNDDLSLHQDSSTRLLQNDQSEVDLQRVPSRTDSTIEQGEHQSHLGKKVRMQAHDGNDAVMSDQKANVSHEDFPTSPLAYSQNHFGNKPNLQSNVECPSGLQNSVLIEKHTNVALPDSPDTSGFEHITQLEPVEVPSNEQNSSTLLEKETDLVVQRNSNNTASIYDENLQLNRLSYSENHFGEKHTAREELNDPEVLRPTDEKPLIIVKVPIQKSGPNDTSLEKKHDPLRENISLAAAHSQKSKIPSTEDLESRFKALERQFSEKILTIPKESIESRFKAPARQFSEKNIVIPKDSELKVTSLEMHPSEKTITISRDIKHQPITQSTKDNITPDSDSTVADTQTTTSSVQIEIITTKSIPTTADLEHRFRELERKLSSKSINVSSKTAPPQQDDLKALRQSTIIAKPSIVLPNNEDTTPTNPTDTSSLTQTTIGADDQPPFIRKRIPSTEDLEIRFEALEIQKSLKSPTAMTTNVLSPSRPKPEFSIESPEMDTASKRKSDIPSTEDLENRFKALEQRKLVENSAQHETDKVISKPDCTIPSAKDLETRFNALDQRKSISNDCTKVKNNEDKTNLLEKKEIENVPHTPDLQARFEVLENQCTVTNECTKEKHNSPEIKMCSDSKYDVQNEKNVPSTQDLETRYEALEQQKASMEKCTKSGSIAGTTVSNIGLTAKEVPSTQDLETRFEALEQRKSIISDSKTSTDKNKKQCKNLPSTQDLETRFEALEQRKSATEGCFKNQISQDNVINSKEIKDKPSTHDLETRFEALKHQKPAVIIDVGQKKLSKVPSTQDLEKRFAVMQIDTDKLKVDTKHAKAETDLKKVHTDDTKENPDQHKRRDLYKLESQSDETLTATDQTSTEFETKVESRPTSCPEYSDPFDSNIVTTDRVLKIIEENSKILHRILKKTLADTGDLEAKDQPKKSHPGITDSLLALGNIFPRSDETISPSHIKSHSWIRPSITLRSDDNISDRLASIKSTIKSIDTLCEEKSFRKEKCQRYIDSLFARPTLTPAAASANPSIMVDDFERKPSQDRIAKREQKKDISPRRRRDEDREEYESRVRRDTMPNSLDAPSDFSFSVANIDQVDSEVDRINQEKQVDTQVDRPLSPYYGSGYDLNKRSITPVVYIPTKLEIRHTTVTSTFYDRYLTEKHIERTFPRSKKSPVSPTTTKSYLDIAKYSSTNFNDRSSKSAENSPSRRKDDGGLSPNYTISSTANRRSVISTLEVAQKDLQIRSCDNILLQLRSSTHNTDIVPSIMVYNPLPTKIRKPPELGISLGLYKDYGSDESSKS